MTLNYRSIYAKNNSVSVTELNINKLYFNENAYGKFLQQEINKITNSVDKMVVFNCFEKLKIYDCGHDLSAFNNIKDFWVFPKNRKTDLPNIVKEDKFLIKRISVYLNKPVLVQFNDLTYILFLNKRFLRRYMSPVYSILLNI